MKAKKLTVIAVLAMALVMLMACGLVSEVESIQLIKAPDAVYTVGQTTNVDANEFKVKITLVGGTVLDNISLTDSRLTVEGLVNGKLDVATPGVKTIKISYMGVSITATYIVEGESTTAEVWTTANEFLAKLMSTESKITLAGDVSLAGKQWPAVELTRNLEIDGNGKTISGLTMTNSAAFGEEATLDAGLFASVAKDVTLKIYNVTFDNVVIEQTNQKQGEFAKNFAVVAGRVWGNVEVSNVTVKNTTIKGNGRIAGIVGNVLDGAKLKVDHCNVTATLIGHNPVAVTNAEGEADKIGGIVGQIQGGTNTITNNNVKVTIAGTRDCGGIVGYVATSGTTTITGNKVLGGSIIALSVEGGMNVNKGHRHAGGLIGTLSNATVTSLTLTGNTIEAGVTISVNEKYADSHARAYVGGCRTGEVPTFEGNTNNSGIAA